MLDEGKRTENDMTWTGLWHEVGGFNGTEMTRCNSQFQFQAVLSPLPQTNMQIRTITEDG